MELVTLFQKKERDHEVIDMTPRPPYVAHNPLHRSPLTPHPSHNNIVRLLHSHEDLSNGPQLPR